MARIVSVVIAGFGSVGRSLARLIALKSSRIEERYGLRICVIGILDSKGAAVNTSGFSPYDLLRLSETPRSAVSSYSPCGMPGASLSDVYERATPDIHVEVTPSDYQNGEPGVSHILYAINNRVNVVSASKGPFTLRYKEIIEAASRRGVALKFKATVMAGTPLIDVLSGLKGYEIYYVEGILNATTNFILSEMQERLTSYEDALKRAQALGIAETDPTMDVKGLDAAAKLTIISNVIGCPVEFHQIERDDVSRITVSDIYSALRAGRAIKYIARLDLEDRRGSVKLREVPRSSVLGSTNGTLNAVRIVSDVNEIVMVGSGGGGMETAHALLDDIITVAGENRP